MSKTVDERVVEMRFDNKQFESSAAESLSTLDKLKKSLKLDGATKGFEEVDKAAKKVNFNPLVEGIQKVSIQFGLMYTVATRVVESIVDDVMNKAKRITNSLFVEPITTGFQEYETQINAVQTILANTEHQGTTLQDVNRALDELNTYADKTIYNFTQMTKNIGTFTAAGVDLQTSVDSIKGIANLAAVSGSTSQQASTAMYQLSQALAAGKVTLMDWNSVVNASMGGKVFQNALIRTSELLGTGAQEAIDTYGSFRDSLTQGEWLTTEVLTETLKQFAGAYSEADLIQQGFTESQAKEIAQMAVTAEDAATKVKTFTQLWDTLKESAQSGWTQTWEILIGDFGEAKETLTEISNVIGDLINNMSNARNDMLRGGFSTGWNQLLSAGIADEAGYIEAIEKLARTNGDAFDKMVEDADDFSDALKKGLEEGVVSSKTLTDAVYNLQTKMSGMTAEERKAAGYSLEMVAQIENLADGLKDGSISMDEFTKKILRPSGRENIIQSLWNTFNALRVVLGTVKEAFSEVFPPITGEQVYSLTEKIRNFTESLMASEETLSKIKRAWRGVFSVIKLVVDFLWGAVKIALKTIWQLLEIIIPDIHTITAGIGDVLGSATKWLGTNGKVLAALNKLCSWIVTTIKRVKEWFKAIKDLPQVQSALSKMSDIISKCMEKLGKIFSEGKKLVLDFIESIKKLDTITLDGIVNTLKQFKDRIKGYFSNISGSFSGTKSVISNFAEASISSFSNAGDSANSFKDKIFNVITEIGSKLKGKVTIGNILAVGVGGGMIAAFAKLSKLMNTAKDIFGNLSSIKDGVTNCLEGLAGALNAYKNSTRSQTFYTIAKSIAILVASLVVLTWVDTDKLWNAVAVLGVVAAILVAMNFVLNLIGKLSAGDIKSTVSITGLAAALWMIVRSLRGLDKLENPERLKDNIKAISVILAELMIATAIIGAMDASGYKNIVALIAMAMTLKILASVIEDISKMDMDTMAEGMKRLSIVMLVLIGLMAATRLAGENAIKAGVGILAISGAMILLGASIKVMAGLDEAEIKKAGHAVGQLLIVIGLVIASSYLAGNNAVKAGTMILMISGAIMILAAAIMLLSIIDPMGLAQAVAAVSILGILIAGLIAVSSLAGKCTSTIVAISIAIGVIVIALAALSAVPAEGLAGATAALTALMGMLAIIVACSGLSENALGTLIGITLVVAAFGIVLYNLAKLPSKSVLQSAIALSVLLVALSAALVLMSFVDGLALDAVVGLVVLTAVVAALAYILWKLKELDPEQAIGVAVALSTLLIAFAVVLDLCVVAGTFAMAAIAGATILLAFIVVFGALMMGIGALCDNNESLKKFMNTGLVMLMRIATGVSLVVNALSKANANCLIGMKVVERISELIFTLTAASLLDALTSWITGDSESKFLAFFKQIGEIGSYIKDFGEQIKNINISKALSAIDILDRLAEFASNDADFDDLIDGDTLTKFVGKLPSIAAYITAFSHNAQGLDKQTALDATEVLTSIAELAENGSDLKKLVEKDTLITFAGLLPTIGSYITAFSDNTKNFKNYTASAATDTLIALAGIGEHSSDLKKLAKNNLLTNFTKMLPTSGIYITLFGKKTKNLDKQAALDATEVLSKIVTIANDIPNSGGTALTWLVGDNLLSDFTKMLPVAGAQITAYSHNVKGLDKQAALDATEVLDDVVDVANDIPNEGGKLAALIGDNVLTDFTSMLPDAGTDITNFSKNVGGLDADAASIAITSLKDIVTVADDIPNTGGWISIITGDNNIGDFAAMLPDVGANLKLFSDNVYGLDADAVSNAGTTLKELAEMAKSLVFNDGGIFGKGADFLVGTNFSYLNFETFAKALSTAAEGLSSFYEAVKPWNNDMISKAEGILGALTSFAKDTTFSEDGGWLGKVSDSVFGTNFSFDNFVVFGNKLGSFGENLSKFGEALLLIDTDKLSVLITEFGDIIELANSANEVDTTMLSNLGSNFAALAKTAIDNFVLTFESGDNKVRMSSAIGKFISQAISTASSKCEDLIDIGKKMITKIVVGVNEKASYARSTVKAVVASCASTISYNEYYSFYEKGKYLVAGFAEGIKLNKYVAEEAARKMAGSAADAAAKELDERSPSKVGYRIGDYFGQGFINGIINTTDSSYGAGTSIASSAKEGLAHAINKINEIVENGIDSQPTIRPLLDISQVQAGVGQLSAMMSRRQAMSISASMNDPAVYGIQNGDGSSAVNNNYNFTQNNYSPKALSRIDIYRQTKNQFSALKGRVGV